MEKKGLNEIRSLFLEFFKTKDHLVVSSYPLVPHNDNSLLLINAGMAPLKPYFSGTEEPPHHRMATCQKCIRTGDIENVGKTARHATFFEMLGNFSFGDYFKEEAIAWGWEFVTQHLKMPVERLWPSIYEEDDEAFEIWNKKVGIPAEKIVRLGKKDNFWEIGLGPCGPCSEIYFDRGEKYGCGSPDCKPGCDCDRYIEFWNLVFTQYDKDEAGVYHRLPKPNIDTGAGLERVACIMQDVDSIYDVDTMRGILEGVCRLTGAKYNANAKNDISIRIITDHARSVTFMVGDGILPSNEGRGYVLRRLLRRAARHGKLLGKSDAFLYQLVDDVIAMYGDCYIELKEKEDYIKKVLKVEEERFQETINQGMDILNDYIAELEKSGKSRLEGERAFKLYDTYGFPLDLTKEILEEKGLEVDEAAFEQEMEQQRQRARSARAGEDIEGWREDILSTLDRDIQTTFVGYQQQSGEGKIAAIVRSNQLLQEATAGEEVTVVLDSTPFYAESGGQVGDKGVIFNSVAKATVIDTKKGVNNRILHMIKLEEGVLRVGDEVKLVVNASTRSNTERNHTATHLLHRALKEIVGDHVQQAGSLVTPERLRFDFTHFEAVKPQQLKEIEALINDKIMAALRVETSEMAISEAKALGAEALFGEKYGETVRVVKSGDYSTELCGGTHVGNTSEIGMLLILSEGGVAAGVRRIEAVTGSEAFKYIKEKQTLLARLTEAAKTQEHLLVNRVEAMVSELKEKEKEIDRLKSQLASGATDDILNQALLIKDNRVILHNAGAMAMEDLRKISDVLKEKLSSGVILLASESDGKANFVSAVTKDLTAKGIHAGNLVKAAAAIAGGGGGGRPDMAQAGGKNPDKIPAALEEVKRILAE